MALVNDTGLPLKVRLISEISKPATASEKLISKLFTAVFLGVETAAKVAVGAVVSIAIFNADEARFWLPAASENLFAATLITPCAVLPTVGVKVAV